MSAVRSIRGFTGSAYNGVISRFNENKDHYRDSLCTVSGGDARVKAVVVDEKFHIRDNEANKFYKPTKHMINQLAQKTKWGSYIL